MRKIRKYIRNRKGQALVEFALILPLFLLMLIGLATFGLVLHDYITMAEAARAGARVAALGGNDPTVRNAIYNAAPGVLPAELTINIIRTSVGNPVTVTVIHPMSFTYTRVANPSGGKDSFFDILPSSTINVTGTAVMRTEL